MPANTMYTHRFKAVECPSCGAPVVTDPDATNHECTYCHSQLNLRPRRKEVPERPDIDEASRIAGLWAQARNPDPNSPLLYRAPTGLETFAAMLYQPEARPAGVAAVRQDWEQTRRKIEADQTPERDDGVRLFRLAILLSNFYALDLQHEHARAVLETGVDLCPEPGQRDILRCALARAALDAGDEVAFEEWLGDMDPRPIHLEVDTALRVTRARLMMRRRQFDQVLDIVGRRNNDQPTSADSAALAMVFRAHAYAGQGISQSAKRTIRELGLAVGVDTLRTLFDRNAGPAQPYVSEYILSRGQSPVDPQTAATAAKAAGAAAGGIGLTGGCISIMSIVVPAILALVLPSVFTVFMDCGGSTQPYTAAVALANSCPTATQLLGPNIEYTPGFSCGNCETSGGSGNQNWSVPVSGSSGSGRLSWTATHTGGPWNLWTATLETDRGDVDLMACAGQTAGMPGSSSSSSFTITSGSGSPVSPAPAPAFGGAGILVGLEAACDGGDANMCVAVGAMYEHGNNAPRDANQARAYYRKACDLGNNAGCVMVGRVP